VKVYLSSLGCKLNQNEIETLARQLAHAGHEVVPDPSDADTMILNTCTVTQVAAKKSCQLARRLYRANSDAPIVLTGCFAEISPDKAVGLPGVRLVVGNQDKNRLLELLGISAPAATTKRPLGKKDLPLLRTRASVKIQDGCDNDCAYCIVRVARGPQCSRNKDDIVAEVQARLETGYKEIVLTGVHIGAYGRDQGQTVQVYLWGLVDEILHKTAVPRLRLSSIEPWDISAQNLTLWQDSRLCRHLHLPLQSGCDSVLSRMRRRYTVHKFAHLVETARRTVPEIALTTDVIVGFPGETEEEFRETLRFVETVQFSKVHVFPYSNRPGTEAAQFSNQIDPQIKRDRSRRLADIAHHGETAFWSQFIDRSVDVLWETQKDGLEWSGLTDHYVRVSTRTSVDLHNTITPVRITDLTTQGLRGQVG
jgi:threonylcarbamoyladenosine tRNA methylthiotransferase MtaB